MGLISVAAFATTAAIGFIAYALSSAPSKEGEQTPQASNSRPAPAAYQYATPTQAPSYSSAQANHGWTNQDHRAPPTPTLTYAVQPVQGSNMRHSGYSSYAECAAQPPQPAQAKQVTHSQTKTLSSQPKQKQASPASKPQSQGQAKQSSKASSNKTTSSSVVVASWFPGRWKTLPMTGGRFNFMESRTLEFKAAGAEFAQRRLRKEACKYICAFLNAYGGTLVYGVTDSLDVHGVSWNADEIDLLQCRLSQALKEQFDPPVDPARILIDLYRLASGRVVVAIHVSTPPSADSKVVYYYNNTPYVRALACVQEMEESIEVSRTRNGRPILEVNAETYYTTAPSTKPTPTNKVPQPTSAANNSKPSPGPKSKAPTPQKASARSKKAQASKTAKKAPAQAKQPNPSRGVSSAKKA